MYCEEWCERKNKYGLPMWKKINESDAWRVYIMVSVWGKNRSETKGNMD